MNRTGNLPLLQLQYGVNAYADHIYEYYQPQQITAYYPDPEASELKQALAGYIGCGADMILCGSGSDELLDLYIRMHALDDPKLQIAISTPTYYQYANYGARVGATIVDLTHDRAEISAALTKEKGCKPEHTIVMLDSPANPTGDIVKREQFIELLAAGYQVFADEAYFEFCGQTVADLIDMYPKQLVVSRSFSKVAAMAGSRVGYVIAHPDLIEKFRKQKLLFNVSSASQHRALFALEHMPQFLEAIEVMRRAKKYITDEIVSTQAYTLHPALDMYTIFSHHGLLATDLQTILRREHSIETYLFPNFRGGADVLRAAILQPQTMTRFTGALKACA
jgi:histidinol-phosphate aminotransferase